MLQPATCTARHKEAGQGVRPGERCCGLGAADPVMLWCCGAVMWMVSRCETASTVKEQQKTGRGAHPEAGDYLWTAGLPSCLVPRAGDGVAVLRLAYTTCSRVPEAVKWRASLTAAYRQAAHRGR
ncbi:hypothetical protein O3P69_018492 [Scylla paramamosain]|uniref:Uncharacterized protein n=1 Tax=Scylla paramamosain TaxID=85552 RepID=A0AAW0T190_SCYPA